MTPPIRTLVYVIAVLSLTTVLLSVSDIPFQVTIWELYLDGKVLLLAAALTAGWWRGNLPSPVPLLSKLTFRWRHAVILFFLPLLIYSVPVLAGLAGGEIAVTPMDNAMTLVLATVFDIPAIFVFSATTILIEEIIFRAVLPSLLFQKGASIRTLSLVTVIWTFYTLSDAVTIESLSVITVSSIILWNASIGLFCSVLTIRSGSIWPGYSFRTGILSVTPIFMTSLLNESDSFFTSSQPWYSAEGVIVSLVIIILSIVLFRQIPQNMQNSPN